MSEENKNKGSWGCFIFVFIFISAGIPAATKGEGPIKSRLAAPLVPVPVSNRFPYFYDLCKPKLIK